MSDHKEIAFVKARLQGTPDERVQPVALRAALRILPVVSGLSNYTGLRTDGALPLYLDVLRTAQISWCCLRYPLRIDSPDIRSAARALGRATNTAATKAGDSNFSKAADALCDAASSIARDDKELSFRSIVNSLQASIAISDDVRLSMWKEIVVDVERLAAPDLRAFDPVQLLVSQRLWKSTRPRWHRMWADRLFDELQLLGEQRFWHGWYEARQRGSLDFGLDLATAERLNVDVATREADFWAQPLHDVTSELNGETADALSVVSELPKTVSGFALDVINSSNQAINITNILQRFSEANFPVVQKTLRGELSRLASAGLVLRVRPGEYAALHSNIISLVGKVQPQTLGALQFEAGLIEPIRVRSRASAGSLRTDGSSRKRHEEVCRRIGNILDRNDRTDRGGNVSSELIEEVELLRNSVGLKVEDVDPDLMIPRGDSLRKDLVAYESLDDFSHLPPIPDTLLLSLKKLVAAYNHYVSFDPELTRRDEGLLGPDAKRMMVPPGEGQRAVSKAVELQAALPSVLSTLDEEAQIAPGLPDPENRLSRRYSEGAKNFARVAIEKALEFAGWAWTNRSSIASGAVATVTAGVGSAKWVLANEGWLLRYFAENSVMSKIVEDLVIFLKGLPPF